MADHRYISHILGEITEQEYEALNKGYKELHIAFGREKVRPAILLIEKELGGMTIAGSDIYRRLLTYGFNESIACGVMRLFSANKHINDDLDYRKQDIEKLSYTSTYPERLHLTGVESLLIMRGYALTDEIFIRPIKGSRGTRFTYGDGMSDNRQIRGFPVAYFGINHKDSMPYEVEKYDHAMDSVRELINNWLQNYIRGKNPYMTIIPTEKVGEDTLYGDEVPDSRIYEFEMADTITEQERFKLRYEKGEVTEMNNIPQDLLFKILLELERIGAWE
jgi:hypothetical protein